MANQRVLVMNGRRVLETAGEGGKWNVEKTDVAPSGMKPGIYNIGNARPAPKEQPSEGMVVHTDATSVYQQVAKGLYVKHDAAAFDKVPAIGVAVAVHYEGAKAAVTPAKARSRSRSL